MQARGPLMIEHRLIERMIEMIAQSIVSIKAGDIVDPLTIDLYVDFIRIYADRTHHGKEEDILFRNLADKPMSAADRLLMNELIAEHALGRRLTGELVAANERQRRADPEAPVLIIALLEKLAGFYPKHIEKEDKIFFPAVRSYFSEEEEQAMLREFKEFDQRMIHEKYQALVENLERKK
jgi:hemerythrin-like domain-containing protein